MAARCTLSWPANCAGVGVLRDARVGTDVAHEHGHDDLFRLAETPAVAAQLFRQAPGEQARERLTLLFAVDDRLVEEAQALERALRSRRDALGQLDEDGLDLCVDRLGREPLRHGDGLDRLALGDHAEQRLLRGRQAAVRGHRADQCVDDRGVEGVASSGDGPDGVDELVALRDVVLQEVAVAGGALRQK